VVSLDDSPLQCLPKVPAINNAAACTVDSPAFIASCETSTHHAAKDMDGHGQLHDSQQGADNTASGLDTASSVADHSANPPRKSTRCPVKRTLFEYTPQPRAKQTRVGDNCITDEDGCGGTSSSRIAKNATEDVQRIKENAPSIFALLRNGASATTSQHKKAAAISEISDSLVVGGGSSVTKKKTTPSDEGPASLDTVGSSSSKKAVAAIFLSKVSCTVLFRFVHGCF
jgi:hypothetical protein